MEMEQFSYNWAKHPRRDDDEIAMALGSLDILITSLYSQSH